MSTEEREYQLGAEYERRRKDEFEKICATFELANITVKTWFALENCYWPAYPNYFGLRTPWYLAMTDWGPIKVGWRKRVLSINWETTMIRKIVTEHAVTKSDVMVHAYKYEDAVSYLKELVKK